MQFVAAASGTAPAQLRPAERRASAVAAARGCARRPRCRGRGRPEVRCASGSGPGAAAGQQEPGVTREELEEAQRALQDFLEGMGASGVADKPEDLDLPEGRLSREEAQELLGMTGWRLGAKVCPAIEQLVTQVESCWRSVLGEDQCRVYPLEERFQYLDSLDPEGEDPLCFLYRNDPPRGDPAYPRLQVENRAYQSRAFRKLHIEVAARQDGLQVFHCVMYPRLDFDLPILSMDVVANDGRVSLAIADPCPLTPNLQLPPFYESPVRQLQERYALESNRRIPDWGAAIFSPLCVIVRPEGPEDLGRFLKYALALARVHTEIAKIAHPVAPTQRARLASLRAGHTRYVDKQLENDKTRRVLEAAFGPQLAERYMREVMFDAPPAPTG